MNQQDDNTHWVILRKLEPVVRQGIGPAYTISQDGQSITCHVCGLTSYNLNDVKNRYCARCHVFHADNP